MNNEKWYTRKAKQPMGSYDAVRKRYFNSDSNKWDSRISVNDIKGDYKRLYREKWEYYGGKADAKIYASKPFDLKVLKTDLSVYITSDEDIINAENKVGYLETVVDYIKGVIKSVDNRGWDIKNAIEWKKFEAGVTY